MRSDLKKVGRWAPGCSKCKATNYEDHNGVHLTHSDACRTRVAEALAEDAHYKVMYQKAVVCEHIFDDESKREVKPSQEQGGTSISSGGQSDGQIGVHEREVNLDMPKAEEGPSVLASMSQARQCPFQVLWYQYH